MDMQTNVKNQSVYNDYKRVNEQVLASTPVLRPTALLAPVRKQKNRTVRVNVRG